MADEDAVFGRSQGRRGSIASFKILALSHLNRVREDAMSKVLPRTSVITRMTRIKTMTHIPFLKVKKRRKKKKKKCRCTARELCAHLILLSHHRLPALLSFFFEKTLILSFPLPFFFFFFLLQRWHCSALLKRLIKCGMESNP